MKQLVALVLHRGSAVVLACAVGCGSSGGPAGVADGSTPASDAVSGSSSGSGAPQDAGSDVAPGIAGACATYAGAYCSQIQACDALGFGLRYGTAQKCIERTALFCPDEVSAPGSTLTPAMIADCANVLSGQGCFDVYTMIAALCAWHGSLMSGSACEYGSQCQSGYCHLVAGTLCGHCEAVPGVAESCDPSHPICQNGLLCADTGCSPPPVDGGVCQGTRQWVCSVPVPDGGACTTSAECMPADLACHGGSCVPATHAGDPCDYTCATSRALDCLPSAGGTASLCTPAIFVAAGQACDVLHGVLCAGGDRCLDATGAQAVAGTCTAPAADGAKCDSAGACLPPALCIDGTCQGSVPASSCK